jgi:hypothetical protein
LREEGFTSKAKTKSLLVFPNSTIKSGMWEEKQKIGINSCTSDTFIKAFSFSPFFIFFFKILKKKMKKRNF